MKFVELQEVVGEEPLFETGLLLSGAVNPADVRRQLSRFVKSGKLIRLRRGLYSLAPPFRKVKPHPFLVANFLQRPSYVSLQSALEYYGLIPEHVPVVTSVTTSRPGVWKNPLGVFEYRHVKPALFFGYAEVEVSQGQRALMAGPEKALLDLFYLHPGADDASYLEELRLENLGTIDLDRLAKYAADIGSPKLKRAVRIIRELARREEEEYEET